MDDLWQKTVTFVAIVAHCLQLESSVENIPKKVVNGVYFLEIVIEKKWGGGGAIHV